MKTSKGERGGANDVVVGTVNGAVHVWDLLTSEIALSLGEKGNTLLSSLFSFHNASCSFPHLFKIKGRDT